ncbi:ATP-binding cassette domain-containing protein [Roseomonas sp. GC11]|uniref:ABC transporter ATP-binding protein n=1 Tax=Roseomonas sp. GC11 TaxID=2950546 RepID=UPI002109F4FC|nr:oligopeptide/dipeptide ABC transporter ATP-binding protein [Roseomonas sp. GC11]MCQ4160392.1 ATP-binding cassette domain-containing protein [Roseomonas sp. GC11]
MNAIVSLRGVSKEFGRPATLWQRIGQATGWGEGPPILRALQEVDLSLMPGEALGLVGESGCGKSTLGRVVAGIHAPSRGTALVQGKAPMQGGRKATTRVQMVFQDPFASLDPRMRIGRTLAEGPRAHGLLRAGEEEAAIARWLEQVGLSADYAERFPHQMSGGQRQRVAIARALAMQPDVLVCDEPVASLDVSIQAQVINLFLRLRRELALSMLFISHDLAVVRHLCDRVAVMYLGRIVETGPAAQVYAAPRHPYTRALLESVPKLSVDGQPARIQPIRGELPSPLRPPPGCAFHARCPRAIPRCREERPTLQPISAAREVACHRPEDA